MKKIIELLISSPDFLGDDDQLTVDTISLVETPAIGYTWLAFEDEDGDDVEMVNGIIELLNKVENIDNRKQMAKDVIKDFINDDIDFNVVDFLEQIGLDYEVFKKEALERTQDDIISIAEEFGTEHDPAMTTYIDEHAFEGETTISSVLDLVGGLDILQSKKDLTEETTEVFKYEGPISSNSRKFCRAMVQLSRTKYFTKPDIERMEIQTVNPGFGLNGSSTYSIFEYLGGPRCQHIWMRYAMTKTEDGRILLIRRGRVDQPMDDRTHNGYDSKESKQKSLRGYLYKNKGKFQKDYKFEVVEGDQQIVVAPVMVPNNLIRRIGENGEEYYVYFSKETVKEISEKYFADNYTNNTNINHNGDNTKVNTVLESWIVEDSDLDKSNLYGFNVPEGSWMMSMKINDDATWNMIKDGQLRGYSVEGNFLELIK
tara:strand:- start:559 stop:1842 length:1284 start_codon:yes stop_codon:yes gene_type:complete